MTEPEQLKNRLDNEIEEVMEEANFETLKEKYKALKNHKEEYQNKKTLGAEEIRERLSTIFPEDETIGTGDDIVRIRDGSAYKNKSPSKAEPELLRQAVKGDDRFTEEHEEKVSEAIRMRGDQLRNQIQNQGRVIMDDDREFDLVTLRLKRGSIYLKLRRFDGGKNHKMQPLEDIENKHVEELHKFITYGDEKVEVIDRMLERVSDAILEVEETLDEIREMEVSTE